MNTKFGLQRLNDGWAVVMLANNHIVEVFDSEGAASSAMEAFERGERAVRKKVDVWLVDDAYVMEPDLGGKLLGEVKQLDMNQFQIVRRLNQGEFDALMEDHRDEDGGYPDT